jgi:hypothetical protein
VCVSVFVCALVCVCSCVRACVCVSACVEAYVCVSVCVYVCVYLLVRVYVRLPSQDARSADLRRPHHRRIWRLWPPRSHSRPRLLGGEVVHGAARSDGFRPRFEAYGVSVSARVARQRGSLQVALAWTKSPCAGAQRQASQELRRLYPRAKAHCVLCEILFQH